MENKKSYKTKQKDLIMECLIDNKDIHIKADEIVYYLQNRGKHVGKTTVYRYLDKLVEEGLVRKYFIEEGKGACYQYADNNDSCYKHFHMKCTNCGELVHLTCEKLDEISKHVELNHNFTIDNYKTVFYGRCGVCESKK